MTILFHSGLADYCKLVNLMFTVMFMLSGMVLVCVAAGTVSKQAGQVVCENENMLGLRMGFS